MKIAIVVAALVIAAVAALIAFRPESLKPAAAIAVKKSDILGFSPGMTLDEVSKLIEQRRYRCRRAKDAYTVECNINNSKVTVDGDTGEKHSIWRVSAEPENPAPDEAAVKSISEQYNAQPVSETSGRWSWLVGRGYKLTYDGAALVLVDEAEQRRLRGEGSRKIESPAKP